MGVLFFVHFTSAHKIYSIATHVENLNRCKIDKKKTSTEIHPEGILHAEPNFFLRLDRILWESLKQSRFACTSRGKSTLCELLMKIRVMRFFYFYTIFLLVPCMMQYTAWKCIKLILYYCRRGFCTADRFCLTPRGVNHLLSFFVSPSRFISQSATDA